MLRASATATSKTLDARAIIDPTIDSGIPGGAELLALVDATLGGSGRAAARDRVVAELGPEGLVDAAGTIANFEMMNRVAEATGIPVGKGSLARTEEWRALLDLDRFRHG